MSGEVRTLRGETVSDGKPRAVVVEALEDLLERARSGDIVGLAVVTISATGSAARGCCGMVGESMIGQLFMLQTVVAKNQLDDSE